MAGIIITILLVIGGGAAIISAIITSIMLSDTKNQVRNLTKQQSQNDGRETLQKISALDERISQLSAEIVSLRSYLNDTTERDVSNLSDTVNNEKTPTTLSTTSDQLPSTQQFMEDSARKPSYEESADIAITAIPHFQQANASITKDIDYQPIASQSTSLLETTPLSNKDKTLTSEDIINEPVITAISAKKEDALISSENISRQEENDLTTQPIQDTTLEQESLTQETSVNSAVNLSKTPDSIANKPIDTTKVGSKPNFVGTYLSKFYHWFFKENPLTKIGIIILFFGFAFLLKLAVDEGFFPLEVRLLCVGVISLSLFSVGFYLRHKKREYALSLQGAGLGGIYFLIYAATKIFSVLPNSKTSMIAMLAVCIVIIVIAIYQRAQTLAFVAILGGFMAPPLMSTGGGTYLQLFSFYTLLSFSIFALTIRFSWQFLHVLGFIMIFGFSTFLGFTDSFLGHPLKIYEPSQFTGSIILLAINMIIYGMAILILNRIHHEKQQVLFNGKYTYHFNITLLLGTPLVGFGILYLLLKPYLYGIAIASVVLGVVYIAAGILFKKIKRISFESERFFFTTIGLGFITISIPLAYTVNVTSVLWALEGSLFLLINHREIPRTTYTMGTALILASAINCAISLLGYTSLEISTIFINAITMMIAAWRWKFSKKEEFIGFLAKIRTAKTSFANLFLLISHLLWLAGIYLLATRYSATFAWYGFDSTIFSSMLYLTISGILFMVARQRLKWRELYLIAGSFFVFSVIAGFIIMIKAEGYLMNVGLYNLVWLPFGAWLYIILRKLKRKDIQYFRNFLYFSFFWALLIANLFLLSLIKLHDLLALESLILVFVNIRYLTPLIRYVGTGFAIIAAPLYFVNHYILEQTWATSLHQFALIMPLIFSAYLYDRKTTYYGDNAKKLSELVPFSTPLLIIALSYLMITVLKFTAMLDQTYYLGLSVIIGIGITVLTRIISAILTWERLQILGHLLLLLMIHQLICWDNYIGDILKDQYIHLGVLVVGVLSYLALLGRHIRSYTLSVGYVIHGLVAGIIVVAFYHLYLVIKSQIPLILPLLPLYLASGLFLIFALFVHHLATTRPYKKSYLFIAAIPLLLEAYLLVNKIFSAPISFTGFYLPLFNLLEMGIVLNLLAVGYFILGVVDGTKFNSLNHKITKKPLIIYSASLLIVTMSAARAFAYYDALPWTFSDLWHSLSFQAAVSVIWVVFGMYAILKSQKNKEYEYWIAGAIPVGLVVIKLFLVDITKSGTLTRGLLFIGIAIILIAVGYFAPMPPRKNKIVSSPLNED